MDIEVTKQKNHIVLYFNLSFVTHVFNTEVKEIKLLKGVQEQSIHVFNARKEFLPFTFKPEVSLAEFKQGDVRVTVIKDKDNLQGKLVEYNSKHVIIEKDNHLICVPNFNKVIFTNDIISPRVIVNSNDQLSVGYSTEYLFWRCILNGFIREPEGKIYLNLIGNIINNTGSVITADVLQLVAKDSHVQTDLTKVQGTSEEDYRKYMIGNLTIEEQYTLELKSSVTNIQKYYFCNTNNREVTFGYILVTNTFIPPCVINLYKINEDNNIQEFLGSKKVHSFKENSSINFIIGESKTVICNNNIKTYQLQINDEEIRDKNTMILELTQGKRPIITKEVVKVQILNYNQNDVNVVLRHYIGEKIVVKMVYNHPKDGEEYLQNKDYIKWYFNIKGSKNSIDPSIKKFYFNIYTVEPV